MIKTTRERTVTIKQHLNDDHVTGYELYEDGHKLFGWNNDKMQIGFATQALFKPLPKYDDEPKWSGNVQIDGNGQIE